MLSLPRECSVHYYTLNSFEVTCAFLVQKRKFFTQQLTKKALIKIMIQALLRVNLGFIYTFNLTMRFHTPSLPCPLKKYHAPMRCI